MNIPNALLKDITDFCNLNDIEDIDKYIIKMIRQGHTSNKFGSAPNVKEVIVEKEVEKIVEKVIEKVVEVPVEVIKYVDKEVYITDDTETKTLTDTIARLEKELTILKDHCNDDIDILENKNQRLVTDLQFANQELNKVKTELEEKIRLENLKVEQTKRDIYGE